MQAFLYHQDELVMDLFNDIASVPRSDQIELKLGKRMSVEFLSHPLKDALQILAKRVAVPLWISREARYDETKVSLTATGPWLSVIDRLLDGTEYRLVRLHDELYWIGKPENRREAENAWTQFFVKRATAGDRVAAALDDATRFEFIATPLTDAVSYLEERHGVDIEILANPNVPVDRELYEIPVTRELRGISYGIALNMLVHELELDWRVFDEVILIGTAEQLERFRTVEDKRLRRAIRLAGTDCPITTALEARTKFEFVVTPLGDVATYLAKRHGVEIAVTDGQRGVPISMELSGLSLSVALDLMMNKVGLDWDTDGETIFVGDQPAVDEFRRTMITK
jgi:hypothetical protein